MMTQSDPLLKAAKSAVADAMSRDFPLDVLLGPDVSRMVSVCNSVVKRHGLLLEQALADALEASGRFEVLRGAYITITPAADSIVASNAPNNLARIALRQDGAAGRQLQWDLIVIDPEAGWAGAYSVKRGNGNMGHRMRQPLAHDVAAVRLLLRSFVRDMGHTGVDTVTSACIDWFGAAKMPPHLTVLGSEADEHFGVPVSATVERMTGHLRAELHGAIPGLLRPVADLLTPRARLTETTDPYAAGPRPGLRSPGDPENASRNTGNRADGPEADGSKTFEPACRDARTKSPEAETPARPAGPDRRPLAPVGPTLRSVRQSPGTTWRPRPVAVPGPPPFEADRATVRRAV